MHTKLRPASNTTLVSGKTFTKSISVQSPGTTISYACKFTYAGGLLVTKYLTYVVNNKCVPVGVESSPEFMQTVYPNHVQTLLHLHLAGELNNMILSDILGNKLFEGEARNIHTLDMSSYKTGACFLRIENVKGIRFIKVVKEYTVC